MGIKTTQNFMLISKLLRKLQKIANKKVTGKRSVQNWSLSPSILLTWKSFWQITFSMYTFFKILPYVKKEIKNIGVMEYICEYYLERVEGKFARNGLTN